MTYAESQDRYLRSLAHVWLEVRSNLLCELSSEEGEWPDHDTLATIALEHVQLLATIMALMERVADGVAREEDFDGTIWRALNDTAKRFGFSPDINWSAGEPSVTK